MVGNASGCYKFLLSCLGTFSLIEGTHPWTSQSQGLQAQLGHLQTGLFLHFLLKKMKIKKWRRDLYPTVKGHSFI